MNRKKPLLVMIMILAIIGVGVLFLLIIKMLSDNFGWQKDKERQAMVDERNAMHEREKEEREKNKSEYDDEVIEETEEERQARYWNEEWVSPVSTPTSAVYDYNYPNFEYTDKTVELKSAEDVYEEVKKDMEARGEEIILEETTDENGEAVAPNLTIYNPIRLEPLSDAADPFVEGTYVDPATVEGNLSDKDRADIAEAMMDPIKMNSVVSTNLILVDLDTNEVVVSRDSEELINPASMSKVMTAIVMADFINNSTLDNEYEMKNHQIQKAIDEKFSRVGVSAGDKIPVKDLFYGMMVCSGADADYALADYLAGSEENMVELISKRTWEMGISDTAHFNNVIGAYSPFHHCTVNDIAVIMATAIQNPLILDAMSTEQYTTVPTEEFEEGIDMSNWFLRRIGTYDTNGKVVAAKTGFVSEAGFCCVSYLKSNSGKRNICVTANSDGNWRTIFDHISLYRAYTK